MGGTEIYNPLSFVFDNLALLPGLPRNLFLLTDGAVTNTNSVLDLVKRNKDYCNVYTLGNYYYF